MAMLATTISNTIRCITSYELFNYSMVQARAEMADIFGFDEPPEKVAILEQPGAQLFVWGGPLINVADKLGYKIERFEELYEKRVAERDIAVGFGTIQKGKVAAVRIRSSASTSIACATTLRRTGKRPTATARCASRSKAIRTSRSSATSVTAADPKSSAMTVTS
jgi:hypothetical protein